MIAGTLVAVTQAGASSCTYSLSSAGNLFNASGGNFTINVTTGSGCAWSATSSASWITFPGSSSGSGNGSVGIAVAANSVGFLAGTVTIGGQTFNVTQTASACGGTDVSSQVQVTRRALLDRWRSNNGLTQQLQLINTGPVIPGPLYVLIFGVCNTGELSFCPFANGAPFTLVNCGTGVLYPALPVAPNGIAADQTIFSELQFGSNPYQNPSAPQPSALTISVISGTPGLQ